MYPSTIFVFHNIFDTNVSIPTCCHLIDDSIKILTPLSLNVVVILATKPLNYSYHLYGPWGIDSSKEGELRNLSVSIIYVSLLSMLFAF